MHSGFFYAILRLMNGIPSGFSDYVADGCDRCSFIRSYLARRGVESVVLPVAGKNHVYVKFPTSQYNPQFRIKTVIAHYDRVPGSPGANDNSAANFCLMDWAERLASRFDFHNIRLLFSDGEEFASGSVASQGAFSLASLFKRLGITNDDVYVFDCMGRGTIPILRKTVLPLAVPYTLRMRFAALEDRAEALLRRSTSRRWLTLPFAYSDNAGFIAYGIPAVAVTMLPEDEADKYFAALIKEKSLENYIVNHTVDAKSDAEEKEKLLKLQAMVPETWKLINTENDTERTLTPESFFVFASILDVLADEKTLVS